MTSMIRQAIRKSKLSMRQLCRQADLDPGNFSRFMNRRDHGLTLGFLFSSHRDFNHLEEDEAVEAISAIHPRHDLIDAKLMKRAEERSLAVHAWTVDDAAEARRLVDLGVRSVITNRPDRIGEALY